MACPLTDGYRLWLVILRSRRKKKNSTLKTCVFQGKKGAKRKQSSALGGPSGVHQEEGCLAARCLKRALITVDSLDDWRETRQDYNELQKGRDLV
jgi:hypothetical protein